MKTLVYLLYCIMEAFSAFLGTGGNGIHGWIGVGIIAIICVCFIIIEKKFNKKFDWNLLKNIIMSSLVTIGIVLSLCGIIIFIEYMVNIF